MQVLTVLTMLTMLTREHCDHYDQSDQKKHYVYKDAHYPEIGSLVFAINLVYNLVYQYTY